jgi:hypothetical protein
MRSHVTPVHATLEMAFHRRLPKTPQMFAILKQTVNSFTCRSCKGDITDGVP